MLNIYKIMSDGFRTHAPLNPQMQLPDSLTSKKADGS
jgi:hypothetical protein